MMDLAETKKDLPEKKETFITFTDTQEITGSAGYEIAKRQLLSLLLECPEFDASNKQLAERVVIKNKPVSLRSYEDYLYKMEYVDHLIWREPPTRSQNSRGQWISNRKNKIHLTQKGYEYIRKHYEVTNNETQNLCQTPKVSKEKKPRTLTNRRLKRKGF